MLLACGAVGGSEFDLLYWPGDTNGEPIATGLSAPSYADPRGWSPTGDRYAFVLTEERRSGPLYELEVATGEVTATVHDLARRWPPFNPTTPTFSPWTPDGSAYAFVVRGGGLLVRRTASNEMVTVVEPDDTYSLVLFGFAPPSP